MTGNRNLRVILDTNTIVSAVIAGGDPPTSDLRRAVDLALDGAASVIVCPRLLDEIEAVLERQKLRPWVELAQIPAILTWLLTGSTIVDDPSDIAPVCRDPEDDFLVALARRNDAVIVTGDSDLLSVPESAGVTVWTPRRLLDALAE